MEPKKVGHIKQQIQFPKELILQFDVAQEARLISPHELWLRKKLKCHMLGVVLPRKNYDSYVIKAIMAKGG